MANSSAQTALDLLVLTVLGRRGPLHGYGIANAIQDLSEEALRIDEGSLYPALIRWLAQARSNWPPKPRAGPAFRPASHGSCAMPRSPHVFVLETEECDFPAKLRRRS